MSRSQAKALPVWFPPTDSKPIPVSAHPPTLSLLHWAWKQSHLNEQNPFTLQIRQVCA